MLKYSPGKIQSSFFPYSPYLMGCHGVINTPFQFSLALIIEPMLQLDIAVLDGGAQTFLGGAEGMAHVSGALAFALDHVGTNVNYGGRW